MGQGQTQWTVLFSLFCLLGSSTAIDETCKDYKRQFERVYSVPGDAAMMNCTLVAPDVFDFRNTPYNITWYNPRTRRELGQGESLWFFNVNMQDTGDYVCVVRTPSQCYKQATVLLVNHTNQEKCARPYTVYQELTNTVSDLLSCPLLDYIGKVDSYLIQWFKGCNPIDYDDGKFTKLGKQKLKVAKVALEDQGLYTCTMTFTLAGVKGRISETIELVVKKNYERMPLMVEPTNEVIKVEVGSSFTKKCRVFVHCMGKQSVDVLWIAKENFVRSDVPERIYQETQSERRQESPVPGVWLEQLLTITQVKEEDLHINYTCRAYSYHGYPEAQFTLLPADPDLRLPVALLVAALALMFMVGVAFYYVFKMDIVLWVRRAFPFLYVNTESDGKLYDAYVAYPRMFEGVVGGEAEMFALHTLPQVLEGRCGYKLFIFGRDSQPGAAIVDAVEESMRASRRLLLLYTGSTFSSSGGPGGPVGPEVAQGQHYECQAAMHRALLERTLHVVLVELEEITPAQLDLFPESVRHLRARQGAVRWWKHQKEGTRGWCWRRRGREEEEKTAELALSSVSSMLSSSSSFLSPSSRFWKELRYHMPVRGKRAAYPERNALLTL